MALRDYADKDAADDENKVSKPVRSEATPLALSLSKRE
jgi:hypothetical protein